MRKGHLFSVTFVSLKTRALQKYICGSDFYFYFKKALFLSLTTYFWGTTDPFTERGFALQKSWSLTRLSPVQHSGIKWLNILLCFYKGIQKLSVMDQQGSVVLRHKDNTAWCLQLSVVICSVWHSCCFTLNEDDWVSNWLLGWKIENWHFTILLGCDTLASLCHVLPLGNALIWTSG